MYVFDELWRLYTKTRTRLFRSGTYTLVLFFGLSLLPSDVEVGTAFANEIMSTIPADDRCRKFADYIVDHYSTGVILHLSYGLQFLNRVRQQPMQLSHSIPIWMLTLKLLIMCFFNRSHVSRPLLTYWLVHWHSHERLLEHAVRKLHNSNSFFTDYRRGELDQFGYIRRVGYRFAP